jgi:dTDP-4-dehydrorhamnose 3,5-epimerase
MKITEIRSLALEPIKVIQFARFRDNRGYFTEQYRKSDVCTIPSMEEVEFVQCNESYSKGNTIRGMHFQWNPYMGKLLRTLSGRMVDIVLDIRKGSETFGKGIMYDMPADPSAETQDWIWVPPGFAHGNYFTEDTLIEYMCSGEYSPGCEAGISPFAGDIDWSLCDEKLKARFDKIADTTDLITEKDREGMTVTEWTSDDRSGNFVC